jgi:transcriptional regulator with XRE-family HTH domain
MLLRRLIGSALRRARLRQGRTLREVAHTARVSMPYLSEVERGRKEVSSEILAAVCVALGLHLVDLLDEIRGELALAPGRPAPLPTDPATAGAAVTPAPARRTSARHGSEVAPAIPGQPVASVAHPRCSVDSRALRRLRSRPPARARRYLRHALPAEETVRSHLPGQRLASFTLAGPPASGLTLTGTRAGW